MLIKAIRSHFNQTISVAEEKTIEMINAGALSTESGITNRFLRGLTGNSRIRGDHYDFSIRSSAIFKPKSRQKPTVKSAADFCIVLDIDVPGFKITKGILFKAKYVERSIDIYRNLTGVIEISFTNGLDIRVCKEKSVNMLSISPQSFIVFYSANGFVVVSAIAISGLQLPGTGLFARTIGEFLMEFLLCAGGDHALKATDRKTANTLINRTMAQTALLIKIRKSRR